MCGYLCIEVDVYIYQHLCEIMCACVCVNVCVVLCAPASVCTYLSTFAYLSIWSDLVGPGLILPDLVYMFAPLFAPPYVRVASFAGSAEMPRMAPEVPTFTQLDPLWVSEHGEAQHKKQITRKQQHAQDRQPAT